MYANKNFNKRKCFCHNHTCWMASHNAVCPSMFFSSRFILVLFNNTCITASFLQNTEQCNGVLNIKIKIKILHNNPIGSEFYLLALFNMTTENYKITTNVSNFVLMTKCSLWWPNLCLNSHKIYGVPRKGSMMYKF